VEELHREPYGSVPFPTGATKPPLFLGVDARVFAPIIVIIAVGVFSRSILSFCVALGVAAALYGAARMLGLWSPYFVDEFARWLDRRSRASEDTMPADGSFHGLDSPAMRRWRHL